MENNYLNIFYLSLSISCTFKVTLVVFADVFEEYYIFCDNNGPLPNVILCALYFKHSLLNWRLKFIENDRMSSQLLVLPNNYMYLELTRWCEIKINCKLSNTKDFSAHDLHWENVIFWGYAAWSYHCLQKRW